MFLRIPNADPQTAMGSLDTEPGKRRLLCVEIPAVERYNEGRDPDFKVQVVRGGSLLTLRYRLKPCHNIYVLENRLHSGYPDSSTRNLRLLPPDAHCPHLLRRTNALPVALLQGIPIGRIENRDLPGLGGALAVRIYTPIAVKDQQRIPRHRLFSRRRWRLLRH